jgi:hypothetical protein
MKPRTEGQQEWFWFIALRVGGLIAALLLRHGARLAILI